MPKATHSAHSIQSTCRTGAKAVSLSHCKLVFPCVMVSRFSLLAKWVYCVSSVWNGFEGFHLLELRGWQKTATVKRVKKSKRILDKTMEVQTGCDNEPRAYFMVPTVLYKHSIKRSTTPNKQGARTQRTSAIVVVLVPATLIAIREPYSSWTWGDFSSQLYYVPWFELSLSVFVRFVSKIMFTQYLSLCVTNV